jgi:hypothetical protein
MPTVNYREVLMRSEGGKGRLSKRGKIPNTTEMVARGVRAALMVADLERECEGWVIVVWYLTAGTHGFATRFGGPRIACHASQKQARLVYAKVC